MQLLADIDFLLCVSKYLPQIDDSHFSGATNEGPENNLEVQIKGRNKIVFKSYTYVAIYIYI